MQNTKQQFSKTVLGIDCGQDCSASLPQNTTVTLTADPQGGSTFSGWSGDDCDLNSDDCDPDPCVNGSCSDGVDSYSCSCDAGWTGTDCDANIDDCDPDPCAHGGTCIDGVDSFTCDCSTAAGCSPVRLALSSPRMKASTRSRASS